MHILHIANDYSGSAVYKNLFKAQDDLGQTQTIYTAVRAENLIGKNAITFTQNESGIIYSHILNFYTRINFYHKSDKICRDIENKISNFDQIDLIHAHTWFSDGVIAYRLYKKYNIPYVITIRNTDMNLFFKYMIHLRKLGVDILKHTKRIIFISQIYKTRFQNLQYMHKYIPELAHKIEIIPNGIDNYWIDNTIERKKLNDLPTNLLFIGNFSANKNVNRLVLAVERVLENGCNVTLHIVGGGADKNNKVTELIGSKKFVNYHGKIYDKDKLSAILRECDIFVMPSLTETFGLVYIEALSQGIPVLYTKNEGIDGLYDSNIGESVIASDVSSIENGILALIKKYNQYNFNPHEIVENHAWIDVATKHNIIYNL